ncbi:MAG: hypothetical protein OEY79_01250 [Anaplasmataceae bacterium]|nr:hypothetical protein [Candidatus Heimdallarchaeota archaeon]MDH5796153.1 hypothetical protein [Anaplasmataceae bacterium]
MSAVSGVDFVDSKDHSKQNIKKSSNYFLKIILRSFDSRSLDKAVKKITDMVDKHTSITSNNVKAIAIPMPNRRVRFTTKRSPHVDSKAGDAFQIIKKKYVIFVYKYNQQFLQSIRDSSKINISTDVHIEFKLEDKI